MPATAAQRAGERALSAALHPPHHKFANRGSTPTYPPGFALEYGTDEAPPDDLPVDWRQPLSGFSLTCCPREADPVMYR